MIKNGYYYPNEFYAKLSRWNYETGAPEGIASVGISIGNRKAGKTVGHAIQMLKNYTEKTIPERMMLLARTDNDRKNGYLQKWWEKVLRVKDADGFLQKFTEEHEITFTTDRAYCDGDVFAYCEAISMSKRVKDTGSYDRCTTIIMDEAFQIGEPVLYIQGRPAAQRIFEIWQTVARGWEGATQCTNLVFIANVSERDNWLFNDLRISEFVKKDTKFTTQSGICVEIVDNEIASTEIAESLMGAVMQRSRSGAEYYEAAQNNKFQDNVSFIHPIGLDFRKLRLQIISRGEVVGIFETDKGLHAAKIRRDTRSKVYCFDAKNHDENTEMAETIEIVRMLADCYRNGHMTFQTLESKGMFLEFVRIS